MMHSKFQLTWSLSHSTLMSRNCLFAIGSVALLYSLCRLCRSSRQLKFDETSTVFITGCDSGLGYSMAIYCKEKLKVNVIATCVAESVGASVLKSKGIHVLVLDLSSDASIDNCFNEACKILSRHNLELTIFVNNAAVMTFGEVDWRPSGSIEKEISINLLGPIKLTKLFLDLILISRARIVNICSHCSLETLPGLVPYAVSKSALLAWTNGLRTELDKYQVKVIAVIPGTFYTQSSIMCDPHHYIEVMKERMKQRPLAIRTMYADYFHNYISYVSLIAKFSVAFHRPVPIEDSQVMDNIHRALTEVNPRALYMCNNQYRYKFYHTIFRWLPVSYVKDKLIIYFMQMPKYQTS